MNIICEADDYKYVQEDGKLLFYNELYQTNTAFLFITAILNLYAPGGNDFNIPLAIEVEGEEDATIHIDRNLKVNGAKRYHYFIPERHYRKWKVTYAAALKILVAFGVAASLVLLYAFFVSAGMHVLMGASSAVVIALTMGLVRKYFRIRKVVKTYEIVNRAFTCIN